MVRLVCLAWLLVDRSRTRHVIDAVSGGRVGVGWRDQGALMLLLVALSDCALGSILWEIWTFWTVCPWWRFRGLDTFSAAGCSDAFV